MRIPWTGLGWLRRSRLRCWHSLCSLVLCLISPLCGVIQNLQVPKKVISAASQGTVEYRNEAIAE